MAEESIEVEIVDVTFRSEDGRFTVAQAVRSVHPDPLPFAVVGDLGAVASGEMLRLTGAFSQHPKFGRRFRATSFVPVMPSTKDGIRRYLGSGMIPGIGRGLAERLVKAFGDQTLEVIASQSGRLRDVDGIGARRAEAIAQAVRMRREEADTMAFLHAVGLGPALARRILKRYGDDATRQLRDDPYLVAEEVAGIGFRTADRIGSSLGIARDDPRRAAGAALHVLARAADSGHVLLPREALVAETSALDVPGERAASAIDTLAARGLLILDGEDVYAPPLHGAERRVASAIAKLARPRIAADGAGFTGDGVELSDEQRAAVEASLRAGMMVLTGGPGTGKTTTVRAIVGIQQHVGRRVLLCAPTGRAAKRLTEATGAEAKTIHRLLEWNPATGQFKRDEDNPLEVDVVLVDEASMLNLRLADSLCRAIAPSSRLILVGDVDQLPPVGAGQVLRDVIESGVGKVVRLERIFRQAQQSAIVRGAHAILRGDLPESSPAQHAGEGSDGELYIIRASDKDAVHRQLLAVMNRIAGRYGFDPRKDVQVLAPVRRGPFGTETLNSVLQKALNAEVKPDRVGLLHAGDKVMQLRNDYDKEVFNGDLGQVARVQGGIAFVRIDGREVQYKVDELDALSLAYASTVHKVQGSEFPAIVVVLHGSHHMLLSRALLYTAVTRAKKLVVLLGDPRAMVRAARNALSHETYSRLPRRLRQAAEGTSTAV